MASTTAPITPEHAAPAMPSMRRAFTVPTKLTGDLRARVFTPETEEQGAETLFAHSGARIVSFISLSSASRPGSKSGRGRAELEDEPMGTLPWASSTERTIAAGPLRIYRVLGTAFLNSGATLRPIMAKSQCWCVDGESKFVLPIRFDSYYRIELPYSTTEDVEKVEEFKGVLAKLLQYEVTPCPFARGFIVELPEPPKTPIRYRPWRPKERSQSLMAQSAQDLGITMEETAAASDGDSGQSSDNEHQPGVETMAEDVEELLGGYETASDTMKTPTRPKGLSAGRAITAPPHLSLQTITHSNPLTAHLEPIQPDAEPTSLSSSIDSFHSFCSFHSPISPLPPSPPYSDPPSPSPSHGSTSDLGILLPRSRAHHRDVSDTTIKPASPNQWAKLQPPATPLATLPDNSPTLVDISTTLADISPALPETPALTNDASSPASSDPWPCPSTPSPTTSLRHRPHRRTHSPLPSPTNLYSPRSRISGHHLTTAILQKTCSLLLGPPIQLVALMLNIARRIADGTLRGVDFGFGDGEGGERERGRGGYEWDCGVSGGEGEVWTEDDYGVSLRNSPVKVKAKAKAGKRVGGEGMEMEMEVEAGGEGREVGGSWEID